MSSFPIPIGTLAIGGIILFALLTIGLIFARLYHRASKEVSFVRTGLGGQLVVMNGGAIVLPVLHETIPVNMNTLRLEVLRTAEQALITKDRMRVDVQAEFYVRVQPIAESIANAAQTLGLKTMSPKDLAHLVEGKFVDALRAVAAEMRMEELHEQRVAFVQKVQAAVSEDLLKNGLELESVSLTGLDQTNRDHFNPNNAFDAEGLTRLTEEIETRRKQRNDVERDTEVAIQEKNLEAERQKLTLSREEEYARLAQQREIEVRRASQTMEIARERAEKEQGAQEAQIAAKRQVDIAQIEADRTTEEQRITKERIVKERDIEKLRAIETAEIERHKTVELTEQDRAIAVAEKSKQESEAKALADQARALAVKAAEQVTTVRDAEIAERQKRIELIKAAEVAERGAIEVTVAAAAEKEAAQDSAEAIRTLARGEADKVQIGAQGAAEAEKLRADAAERMYTVEAAGKRALHEAANILSNEQIGMEIKLALIKSLPAIIEQSVKPMEQIDSIKILQVDGLHGSRPASGAGNGSSANALPSGGNGNLTDDLVQSALKYRAQAPLLDSLLGELGFKDGNVTRLKDTLLADSEISLGSSEKSLD